MAAKYSWPDMFRAHTCFKALIAVKARVDDGEDLATVEIESVGRPCRQCRAWWRRGTQVTGVVARIDSEEDSWSSKRQA